MSAKGVRRRRWLFPTIVSGLVVALAAVALGRGPGPTAPPNSVAPRAEAPSAGEDKTPPPMDPSGVRDVFRFADPARPATQRDPSTSRVDVERTPTPGPSGLRLVGLVRRAGRLMVALSVDGDVELAGAGDRAAGVTVLSVGDEGVRVRLADGTEQTLLLP